MSNLLSNVEFWKSIAPILWPVVVFVIFLSARTKIYALLNRQNLNIKVGGLELNVADATQNIGQAVADLQKKLSDLELRLERTENSRNPPEQIVKDEPARQPDSKAVSSAKQFSVLWVDDYPSNNAFLIEQFKSAGIDVQIALTTKEAISTYTEMKPDLVITDLGRREDGVSNAYAGLALIRQIRSGDQTTPIVVFSGDRGIQNRTKLVEAGAADVFRSGVDLQSFISSLRSTSS